MGTDAKIEFYYLFFFSAFSTKLVENRNEVIERKEQIIWQLKADWTL